MDLRTKRLIVTILNHKEDYSEIIALESEASTSRQNTKEKLIKGYRPEIFYVSQGKPLRNKTLFYDLVYGNECRLAGTGLFESHFQCVFQHKDFEKVVSYMIPEMKGLRPWNFGDDAVLKEFCHGIFDFDIPSYKEVIPIRLATYFYPNLLLPIFKISELKEICGSFHFYSNAKSKGESLFCYNKYLLSRVKTQSANILKVQKAYLVKFTLELRNRLKGESYDEILQSCNKVWIKKFMETGKKILDEFENQK